MKSDTFESFVNSEEYQTVAIIYIMQRRFESFVNSEEYQTKSLIMKQMQ